MSDGKTQKQVARHVLDTRAANKILNILEKEPAAAKRRILSFVAESLADQQTAPLTPEGERQLSIQDAAQ